MSVYWSIMSILSVSVPLIVRVIEDIHGKEEIPMSPLPIIWMRLNEVLKKLDGILREILENKVNRLNGFRFNRCK